MAPAPIPNSGIQNAVGIRKIIMPYSTWLLASQHMRMFGYDPRNSADAGRIYRAVVYAK